MAPESLEGYHNHLVRLRMLVVETLDPEMYVGAVQEENGVWKCGKYGNTLALENPTKGHVFWERRPVRVIPIPGLSAWTTHSYHALAVPGVHLSADVVRTDSLFDVSTNLQMMIKIMQLDMLNVVEAMRPGCWQRQQRNLLEWLLCIILCS